MDDVNAMSRLPPQPGQDREEPELAEEDDIPSDDHTPQGTQPGRGRAQGGGEEHAHDGDEVERHGDA